MCCPRGQHTTAPVGTAFRAGTSDGIDPDLVRFGRTGTRQGRRVVGTFQNAAHPSRIVYVPDRTTVERNFAIGSGARRALRAADGLRPGGGAALAFLTMAPPIVTVTRRLHFNAAHRVHNPALSEEENTRLFGKCNNPNWHGHNYVLDVSVTGPVDEKTGYVIDLARLKEIVTREVLDKVDHRNFNLEVDFMHGVIPTTENIVVGIWRVLEPVVAPGRLSRLVLWETPHNGVEYDGR
jgi:6-pyruvoyltetrahydropterin/6-carboxytetrahydropterin synthase